MTPHPDLIDYWQGDDTHEDHVFACDDCTRRLRLIAAIASTLPDALRRRGGLQLVLTADLVSRLEAEGVVMRHYRPGPNEDIACTVTLADDLNVTWVLADPGPDERLDVTVTLPDGTILGHGEDLPLDAATGRIIFAAPSEFLRPLPTVDLHLRVTAVSPTTTRTVASHVMHHTGMQR